MLYILAATIILYGFFTDNANASLVNVPLNELPFQLPSNVIWDVNAIDDQRCRDDVQLWTISVQQYFQWAAVACGNNESCTAMRQKNLADNLFAVKQLDSFGKPPSNILGLNMVWLGSWDECVSIKAANNYAGKFFWVTIAPDLKRMGMSIDMDVEISCGGAAQLHWSVCMPERCSDEDITTLFKSANNNTDGLIEFCEAKGQPPHAPKKKFWFWMVCGFCLLIAALVIVTSVIDYCTEVSDTDSCKRLRCTIGMKFLLAFSAYTNGAEILSTKKRAGQIHSLNCIRAVSMTWVVMGHIAIMYQYGDNPLDLLNSSNYFLNEVFLNAFPSVDSFLFIGGVLLGFLFFKEMNRNRKSLTSPVYWSLYYIHRYIRLSIPYFLFLGFYTVIWPYVIRGPQQINSDIELCKKYWWRNVLYISSFFPTSEMCMLHTWYLSTDMWIHNFSPILLVPLLLSPIFGGIVALALMILTIAATYGLYYKYDFPATTTGFVANLAADPESFVRYMKYIYTAPWIRYIPNLFGILFGYIMFKIGNRPIRIHWLISLALWIAAAATGIGCIYGVYDYNRSKTTLSTFESASYYIFHRVGWSLALGWAVLACHFNKAGFIKNFMEHGFWMPLARLGYCAYLIHFLVIYIFLSQDRTVLHYVGIPATYIHAGIPCFVLSYAFAFVWSCCIEIPFAKLEKMITTMIVAKKPHAKFTEHNNVEKDKAVKPLTVTVSNVAAIQPNIVKKMNDTHHSTNVWSTDELEDDEDFSGRSSQSQWNTGNTTTQNVLNHSVSTEEPTAPTHL